MKFSKAIIYIVLLILIPLSIQAKSRSYSFKKLEPKKLQTRYEKLNKLPPEIHQKIFVSKKTQKLKLSEAKAFEPVNLLVLLIDFVPDDDSKTTGNGKFDFGEYDYFEINGVRDSIQTIGSPPHDSTFFHQTIKAMQYYYQTASLGVLNTFNPLQEKNFHFKIFPHQADTAYHMPQQMAYYWPDTEDNDLRSDRLIQYFKDAITTADTTEFEHTPDIIFSDYNHIMILHAGSDWQHDVFWDTPCDIPSCYFTLRDDSVAVNDSTYFVKEGGNSPETISQDFYKSNHFIYGFGTINAEVFHEFGHGLGFVDLYNTSNMYPAVGYWDIMDSGGFGSAVLIDTLQTPPDSLVIEAVLPTLPSAWSRELIWGKEFKASGRMLNLTSPAHVEISAAELNDVPHPQFIKIPINDKEYYLIENREVELDNQGAPIIKVDEITGRVPLYPMNPETEQNNYEFDYFLPTYDAYKEAETNGGLCIWHIDDYVIYDQQVEIDGEMYSRFDANMINAVSSRRGVKLIEADGIEDIGNPYSNYAYGTCYEPFFKTRPGTWTPSDTSRYHNYKFAPNTFPASRSNEGINSLIEVTDISNYGVTMSFTFQYQTYDQISSYVPSEKFNPAHQILAYKENTFESYNVVAASDSVILLHNTLFGNYTETFSTIITQPLSLTEFNNKNYIISTHEDSLCLTNFDIMHYPPFSSYGLHLDRWITDSPVQLDETTLLIPTDFELYKISFDGDELQIMDQIEVYIEKIALDLLLDQIIAITHDNHLKIFDSSLTLIDDYNFNTSLGNFYPVVESIDNNGDHKQKIFVQDNSGSVYHITNGDILKIFNASTYQLSEPSNISLGDINNDGIHDLVFTTEDRTFILQQDGSFLDKSPIIPYDVKYSAVISPLIGHNVLAESIALYLPTSQQWTQAIDEHCMINNRYSFANGLAQASPQIIFDQNTANIYLPVSDSLIKNYQFSLDPSLSTDLYWNGYKNGSGRTSCVTVKSSGSPDSTSTFSICAYPNPATSGEVRIRITSDKDLESSIKIYNLAADILFSDKKSIVAHMNNEYVWPINNIASGVYFAKIKVDGKSELVKIGITK
ncbi:MAG TPA: T9SS type A sorting domain-containing protein [Candidatus Cloacimonetes bacterium]|nr:T9SS type A sorting domain-containing protein [Candidatus Cloacimonadota bacterium]HEX38169.1 T9SS type A sorting domain-containing protein [Candidatus Cloacimonadota bacterium]